MGVSLIMSAEHKHKKNKSKGVMEMKLKIEDFTEMIRDWQADNAPEYDDLKIEEPEFVDGKWIAAASDDRCTYQLSDDGACNIVINYVGTK
jgi:hypothetical protein